MRPTVFGNSIFFTCPVSALLLLFAGPNYRAEPPSFDCGKASEGSIEALICADSSLSALDRKLAEVYAQATKKAANEHPPTLKTMQRGWIKGRDECWKSEDKKQCVRDEYTIRIAELQARYRLVPAKGPIFYFCDGNRANEVVATFFETEPPSLIAERGDSSSLMFLKQSASGSKYEGGNESFWEHQGEVMLTWGYEAPTMKCEKAPQG
ncbi:MliC family protein [Dokdonella sp.]|uniref:MliC family protein n=1 Tax=Dokdonella sp. TaxID=2291710 RepID=UPI0035274822